MFGRIVEIAQEHRHLSLQRGFLVVSHGETEVGRIPIDDTAAVIGNAYALTYTSNLLVALAEHGAPLVVCGSNHNVASVLMPIDGHWQQARRLDAQIASRQPLRKRLWADLVRAKLLQQAAVLKAVGAASAPLIALAAKVRSGDPDNKEAQGARRYWTLLFGPEFRRDLSRDGANALLNYGYTVLRAATVRAVVAAGLHPTLGLHHSNETNTMRLADDLMEPFRPLIDHVVLRLVCGGRDRVEPGTKGELVHLLYRDMVTPQGITPLGLCIQRLAISLAQVFVGERASLELPPPGLPLEERTKAEI